MSQKELLEAISRHAGVQTEKILAEADQRAKTIVKRAEGELGKVKEGILEQARSSMATEEVKIVNDARLNAKREMLAAKHELVTRAMKGLEKKLAELPKRKDYPKIMENLLRESLEGVTGAATVRCRPDDRKLVEGYAAQHKIQLSVESADFPLGGVEVFWGEKRELMRKNTFQSRLEKIYPELLQEANRLILGGPESK